MPPSTPPWLLAAWTALIFAGAGVAGDAVLAPRGLRPREPLARLAAAVGTGLLVLLVGTALLRAQGWSATYGVAAILIAGGWRAGTGGAHRPASAAWWRSVALGAAAAAVWAWGLAAWLVDGAGRVVRAPIQRDASHYAVLTAWLDRMGVETPGPAFVEGLAADRSPYHYLDVWLGVACARLGGLGHVAAYQVVAQALLAVLFVVTAGALARRVAGTPPALAIGCAVAAGLPGLDPLARLVSASVRGGPGERLIGDLEGYVMSPLLVNKLLPAAVLVGLAMLAGTTRRGRGLEPWLWAALPAVYVTFVPLAWAALGLRLLTAVRRRRWGEVRARGTAAAASVTALAAEAGAAWVARAESLGQVDAAPRAGLAEVLAGAARVLVGASLRLTVVAGLLAAVVLLGRRTRAARRWWGWWTAPVGLGLVGSAAAWAVVHRTLDSWQVLTTASACVFALGTACGAALALRRLRGAWPAAVAGAALGAVGLAWGVGQLNGLAREADRQWPAVPVAGDLRGPVVWLRDAAAFRTVWDFNVAAQSHPVAFQVSDEPGTLVIPVGAPRFEAGVEGERQRAALARSAYLRATRTLVGAAVDLDAVAAFLRQHPAGLVLLDRGLAERARASLALDRCSAVAEGAVTWCTGRGSVPPLAP